MKPLEFFSKYQKFIIASCLLLLVFSFFDKVLSVGTIFVFFLASISMSLIGQCKEEKQRKILGALFLIILSLHILVVLFFYYTNFQPFSGGYGDYVVYDQQAQEIVGRVQQGNFSLQNLDLPNYYPAIIGYIYAFTIPSMLMGQLFNAWLATLIAIFVYLIVREAGRSEKEGFLVGLIASVYPSLVFFGSLMLKDSLVVLLSIIGLLLVLKIIKRFSWSKFLAFYIILTALIHFRFYIGFALMFSFIISWFLVSTFSFKKRITYGVIILFLLGFSPQFLGLGYYGFKNFGVFLNVEKITYYREKVYAPSDKPSQIQSQQITPESTTPESTTPQPTVFRSGRGSSVVIKTGFENPLIFLRNTALSFACAFLGPFPWQITRPKHLFVLPELIAWYFLLFFIIKGITKSIREQYRVILPVLIFSLLVFGTLALFITNFGIITRIRIPAFLSLLCLFPFGFKWLKDAEIPLLSKIFNI
ncbi:MAG: glycosyltransferase family 39 protein [Candidatus Staskawiczbacteria bacterium]|jgi:hypothetical protein